MAVIEVKPLVFKDIELIIGAKDADDVAAADPDFRKHVDNVTCTPSSSTITWTGLGLNTFTDVQTATWAMTLGGAQDWDSENSLARFLYEHEGETRPYELRPRAGTGPSFTGQLIVTPGAIGGAVNAVAPFSVTLGLTGKPELLPAE